MNRLKQLFRNWQAERQRVRELHIQLENLTDHRFFDRVAFIQRQEALEQKIRSCYIKFHDRHYRRLNEIQKWVHRVSCLEVHNG